MNKLSVAYSDIDGQGAVFWMVGDGATGGCVFLNGSVDTAGVRKEDMPVVSELFVLRHLLSDKKVMGPNRTGSNLYLYMSQAGRVLESRDKQVRAWSRFLYTRYSEAHVNNFKLSNMVGNKSKNFKIEELDIKFVRELVNTPVFGRVEITRHAMERHAQRSTTGPIKSPWKSLSARLQSHNMKRIELPDHVRKEKLIKYGDLDQFWLMPNNSTHLVIRDEGHYKTLITVFERHDSKPREFNPEFDGKYKQAVS